MSALAQAIREAMVANTARRWQQECQRRQADRCLEDDWRGCRASRSGRQEPQPPAVALRSSWRWGSRERDRGVAPGTKGGMNLESLTSIAEAFERSRRVSKSDPPTLENTVEAFLAEPDSFLFWAGERATPEVRAVVEYIWCAFPRDAHRIRANAFMQADRLMVFASVTAGWRGR